MYKRILVPTDGSKLSQKAIRTAVRLAKITGGGVTGIYVTAPYVPPAYSEGVLYSPYMTRDRYRKITEREAKKALAAVEIESGTAGVQCKKAIVTEYNPWKAIVNTAKSTRCDLVVMASHGRRGLAGLVLGSETNKVLTHSKIPVLVCR